MIPNQRIIGIGVAFICLLLFCLSSGCTGTGPEKGMNNSSSGVTPISGITLVELYHFHGDRQCPSCIRLGDMAEEMVNATYPKELASGKLVFAHINYDDPKNAELTKKFEASSSSLMIGVHTKTSFVKDNLVGAWYRTTNPKDYNAYLKEILDPVLKGER